MRIQRMTRGCNLDTHGKLVCVFAINNLTSYDSSILKDQRSNMLSSILYTALNRLTTQLRVQLSFNPLETDLLLLKIQEIQLPSLSFSRELRIYRIFCGIFREI